MTYASTISADSPVAWWKLNETVGTSAADSGSGVAANGTYTGGYTLGKGGIDGSDAGGGTSVLLNGSTGYIDIGSLPSKLQFASGTSFSIEAWVYFPQSATIPGAAVVSEAFAGDGNVRYMLGFGNTGGGDFKPCWGWYNGAWRVVNASTALTKDVWHHLVGTYDGGANQLELWVDNSSVGTLTPGGTQPTGTESLYIGRRWDTAGNTYFNGYVDEVAMYNVKLTSTQIGNHYSARNVSTAGQRQITQLPMEIAESLATLERRVSQLSFENVEIPAPVERRLSQLVLEIMYKTETGAYGWGYSLH